MAKTRLFIIRHGKQCLIQSVEPRMVRYAFDRRRRTRDSGSRIGCVSLVLEFVRAASVTQVAPSKPWEFVLDELGLKDQLLPRFDKRIREWCLEA